MYTQGNPSTTYLKENCLSGNWDNSHGGSYLGILVVQGYCTGYSGLGSGSCTGLVEIEQVYGLVGFRG